MRWNRPFLKASALTAFALLSCKTNDFTGDSKKGAEEPPIETKSFQQLSRESRSVTVKQGSKGAKANENYEVTARGILDLLVVVDTSGSMQQEQQNLASRMIPLMSAVKDSDWQIAVATTDPNDRCISALIQKNDFFPETRFKAAINAGTDGTGIERPILKAVDGLKNDCLFSRKWVRPNSTVAVLIITDEDNCHIDTNGGYGCVNQRDKEGKYLTDYLSSIRKIGTEARVYGLFWHPSQPQSQCSTALKSANIISDVVTATGGTWGSICDTDYSATLTKISTDVAKILKADFNLKSVPDAGSLKITVGGQPWTDYTLTGTQVHFTKTPPSGSPIAVTYVSGAAGLITNEFALPSTPAPGSVDAKVGPASVGTARWDEAKQKVVLSTTPPDGSTIVISYKENTPLKDSFAIAPNADPGHVRASINGKGVASSEFSYERNSGLVKFKIAPPEGSKIDISWRGPKKAG